MRYYCSRKQPSMGARLFSSPARLAAAIVVICCPVGAQSHSATLQKSFQVAAQEFSYSEDPARPPQMTEWTVARRSNGTHMVSFSVDSPTHEKGAVVEIFDFVKLTYAFLEPFTESVSTYRHTAQDLRGLDGEKPGCTSDELALAKASGSAAYMLGYLVVPITTAESESGGGGTKWVAPALDCYPLKETQIFRGSHNEITVTGVAEGEPPANLFTVPSNYIERPPSQVDAEYWTKYNEHLFDEVRRPDQDYFSHQGERAPEKPKP